MKLLAKTAEERYQTGPRALKMTGSAGDGPASDVGVGHSLQSVAVSQRRYLG